MNSSINVLVRARPLSQSEIASGAEIILTMDRKKTYLNYVKDEKSDTISQHRGSFSQKQFLFDQTFWSVDPSDEHYTDQEQIFNEYGKKAVKSAIEGYNTCVFAYGQTGSGKTFTMMGTPNNVGIIPRICEGLFKQLTEMRADNITSRLEVSFMEIYNEQVRDLLNRKSSKSTPQSLKVREHPKEGPFVQGLSVNPVTDYHAIEMLLEQGNSVRITAGTKMNALSSRSHSIFTLKLTQAKLCGNIPSETVSKVHLVDLAGSERIAKSGMTGIRLKEGGNINKSLTTLGLVISALAENSSTHKGKETGTRRPSFVPYRDSILTWLLKDSIGGNSRTIMIATVSPAHLHYGETLSTLRYASRARKIINKPIVNEDPNVKTIRELRSEIEKLRQMLEGDKKSQEKTTCQKVEAKLKENEERADQLTKHWLNKITEAQKIFEEKSMSLIRQGQQTVLTSAKPHLVGLEVDPLSTDIIIYHLEEGKTVIGSCDLSDEQGIALEGSGIEQEHCTLNVSKEKVILKAIAGPTYINNQAVQEEWELRQGDVLQFGHFLKFRFHNPLEAAMLREKRRSGRFSPPATVSGRFSPAVMLHYRSLDSGLSCPDEFDNDFTDHLSQENEQVLNSTAASIGDPNLSRRSNELLEPYRESLTDVPYEKKESSTLRHQEAKEGTPCLIDKELCINRAFKTQKQFLKSSSASEVRSNPKVRSSQFNQTYHLDNSKSSEIYLSAENLHTSPPLKQRTKPGSLTSPTIRHTSSESDLSLSTDDLAFNLLLQSQMRSSASSYSACGNANGSDVYNTSNNSKSYMRSSSYDRKSQSVWEISPRKFEEVSNRENHLTQCESLSVLHRRSFNGEEIFVCPGKTGSQLAKEAKDTVDQLKDGREQLKHLIEEYRAAEISRMRVEKENMEREQENDIIFSKQQSHLQELIDEQKIQLEEAKNDLKNFKKQIAIDRQSLRERVDIEVDSLLSLKEEHLPYFEWSQHELRKKKFKLKIKIENYWKHMDAFETLLMELQLEKKKVKRDNDEKLQEKIKQFECQQTIEMNELREAILKTEDSIIHITNQIEREKANEIELQHSEYNVDVEQKICEAEKFCEDVKLQEEIMLKECQNEIDNVEILINYEKEKLFKYTIYRMHECTDGLCELNEEKCSTIAELEKDCQLPEQEQRSILKELDERKTYLESEYAKKMNKYNVMRENAEDTLIRLRDDQLLVNEQLKEDAIEKKGLIQKLETQLESEKEVCKKLRQELKAYERPRSFISECPDESEEDIIANELQIQQLLHSKQQTHHLMKEDLEKEFQPLKDRHVCKQHYARDGCKNGNDTENTSVDQALSLVIHAGDSSVYTNILMNKYMQYEKRKKSLQEINTELHDLMKHHMSLHREIAENILKQKNLFEDVRSQERKDIHDTIQTLIQEGATKEDHHLIRLFQESEKIVFYQERLDKLETEMYEKVAESHILQEKLDHIQERLSEKNREQGQQHVCVTNNNPFTEPALVSGKMALTKEFDDIQKEKEMCEVLIAELQKKLSEERKDYLDLLKSKDDYDVIGPEYRAERHSLFQTEGNKSAADILTEIFQVENLLEMINHDPSPLSSIKNSPTVSGWRYVAKDLGVQIFRKQTRKSGYVSILGRGIIKAPPKVVWETIRNPLSRLIYDKMVKKINVIERFTDQLKVIYFQHHTSFMFMKQRRDCCCVHNERIENNKYIAAYKSIEHPDCPARKGFSRMQVEPSGWLLQPFGGSGEDWCLAWYIVKVDLAKGYLPSYFVESLVQKLPLSISSLRDYLVLSY